MMRGSWRSVPCWRPPHLGTCRCFSSVALPGSLPFPCMPRFNLGLLSAASIFGRLLFWSLDCSCPEPPTCSHLTLRIRKSPSFWAMEQPSSSDCWCCSRARAASKGVCFPSWSSILRSPPSLRSASIRTADFVHLMMTYCSLCSIVVLMLLFRKNHLSTLPCLTHRPSPEWSVLAIWCYSPFC